MVKSSIGLLVYFHQTVLATPPQSKRRLSIINDLIQSLDTVKTDIDSNLFLYQTPAFQWIPSTVYRYDDFRESLNIMSTEGVAGKTFYTGEGVENGYVYGMVNVAAFLAQSMKETIQYDACDENSWDLVNGRYPLSNACGQLGQSYQDYHCSEEEKHMECPVDPNMSITGVTHAKWYGAPGPLFCGPKTQEQPFSGFWDHTYECNKAWANPPESCDVYDDQKAGRYDQSVSVANTAGRTDVEGCCWWGRGVIQTSGVCNFGKLNYFLGAGAAKDGRASRYPNIDFCKDPEIICSSSEYKELKWIAGMFYWIESVQGYNVDGWDYLTELRSFVEGGMTDHGFIDAVSGIVNRGCHNPPCGTGPLDGGMERADNFKKVLFALFGSTISEPPVYDTSNSETSDEAGNQETSPNGSNDGSNGNGNSSGSGPENEDGSSSSSSGNSNVQNTAYYPDYNPTWSLGKCINDGPPPLGRPNYSTLEECCNKAYGGQASGACLGLVSEETSSEETDEENTSSTSSTVDSSTPSTTVSTTAPRDNETPYYPDYNPIWSLGKCINDGPAPSGRPNFDSHEECCNMAYGGQASGVCLGSSFEDEAPAPNDAPVSTLWYPDYNALWSQGKCTDALPFENGRPTYDTQLECCQNAYRGQASGVCLSEVANLSSEHAATQVDSLDMWYADYNPLWAHGKCIKQSPVPDHRPWYYTQSECCEKVYGGQASGACLEGIEAIPIESEGSFANAFTSYLQSQRYNDLIIYSCDAPEIPSNATPIDISYEYEYSVPKTVRADLVLAELKRRMMEHVADEFGCQSSTVPRKLRRKEVDAVLGFQASGWSDVIDTKKAQCRQSIDDAAFVCAPVVGHLVAFVDQDSTVEEIAQAKVRILNSIAGGQYTSESIKNVVYVHQLQETQNSTESAPNSKQWVPIVASLFSILAIVLLGVHYLVLRRRRLVKIQEHTADEEEIECASCSSEKIAIDRTARLSEYSSPTSERELEDEGDPGLFYQSDSSTSEFSQCCAEESGHPCDSLDPSDLDDEKPFQMSSLGLEQPNQPLR